MGAPTLVQYAETSWSTTGSSKATGTVTWQSGDILVVLLGTADQGTNPTNLPTATGLTFAAISGAACTAASDCYANAYSATAGSGGSSAVTSPTMSGSLPWGMAVWVWRGSTGLGNVGSSTTTANNNLTQSLIRAGTNSTVCGGLFDWAAASASGYGWTPAVANDRQHQQVSGQYTVYVADWGSQDGAGTTSYGITGVSGAGPFARLFVEVKGSASVTPAPFYPRNQAVRARYPQPQAYRSGLVYGSLSRAGDTSYGSGRVTWNAGGPVSNPTSGPVFRQASQPARARIPQGGAGGTFGGYGPAGGDTSYGSGRAMWNAGGPVRNPAPGPVFRQRPVPVRYVLPPWQPRAGRIGSAPGGPVINPRRGPPVYAPQGPVQAKRPLLPRAGKGTVSNRPGGPVRNPSPGPAFAPAVQAVRARLPRQPFLRGRASGSPGVPVISPVVTGPPFRQATQPARARIPQNGPRGRAAANPAAPVRNPNVIAVSGSMPGPVRASLSVPARGRAAVRPYTAPAQPSAGPPFRQAASPARARIPGASLKGRAASNPGGPVRNPHAGPAFRQAAQPSRARVTAPLRGRITSGQGAPVTTPPPVTTGPPVYGQAQGAAAVRWAGRGRAGSGASSLIRNPSQGPVFTQATWALRARLPYFPPPRGRVASSFTAQAAPVPNAVAVTGAIGAAVRAALPVVLRGKVITRPGTPVRNPSAGPAFRLAVQPARIHPVLPPRGRTAGNPGGPVRNPAPPGSGPVFRPFTQAVRARLPFPPPKGRVASSPGTPPPPSGPPLSGGQPAGIRVIFLATGRAQSTPAAVRVSNPQSGPVFRQAVQPAQAKRPLPPRGRASGSPGGPVQNPVPGIVGPPFYPFRQAVHIRFTLPPRGRTEGNPGALVRNPHQGGAFPAWHRPVQARQPLPPRGRVSGNPGGPLQNPPALGPAIPQRGQPVHARFPLPPRGRTAGSPGAPLITQGPAFRQFTQPVQARHPLPPRGRTGSNPGGPLQNPPPFVPPFVPPSHPARIRPALPPRGRVTANPGGPVRNPSPGPVFRQAVRPARAVIPQNAPRGRTGSNPGGPVENIPFATLLFRLGSPYFQWATGTPEFDWAAETPVTSG